ncbi:mitochondrial ribosomal protein S25-domain-containing protein [Lipomyces japonicus]|uniref:mitochondrial 37S ribosomal protein mS23 n=1 Tax=Lipomyces japonicus TaxID=56871 RepID=UPI0034CD4FF7
MSRRQHLHELVRRTSRLLEVGALKSEPAWYKAVIANPPATDFIPKVKVQNVKDWNVPVKDLFKPQSIVYPEDKLRSRFYKDHPWELARPKVLVERDALDFTRNDWSKLDQPLKRLDGESVVQRTLWLIEKKGSSEDDAYDQACKEFYSLRIKEEVEIQTTEEEARMFGSVFFLSEIEIALELESKSLKNFKEQISTLQGSKN